VESSFLLKADNFLPCPLFFGFRIGNFVWWVAYAPLRRGSLQLSTPLGTACQVWTQCRSRASQLQPLLSSKPSVTGRPADALPQPLCRVPWSTRAPTVLAGGWSESWRPLTPWPSLSSSAGVSDHVKCFHCDGGLRNWVPGDNPWTEHARWFSRCGFVRLVKGDDFIQDVLREHPQEAVPQAAPADTAVKRCPFSDEEVEKMMENAICKTAVELGVAREAVKRVLKQRLESTGVPFTDLSSVLAMAVDQTQGTYAPAPPPPSPPTTTSGRRLRHGLTSGSEDEDMEATNEG
ncbi:baculoviral IAP repeat-containing protein 7-A-like, partial [Pollicipes pollicipes]|uniref:baculoviral IAP repeat-containing protein 7-A-like n=1 Tax=Pollicipes pollicipes TaxID=41117 RepID=UPI001884FE35